MKSAALVICGVFVAGIGALSGQTPAGTSVPKAYGTNFQTLHVGATSFRSVSSLDFIFDAAYDGYIYNDYSESTGYLVAPVTLPPGAEVHALCAYLFDDLPQGDVQIQLRAGRLIPGGLLPGVVDIGPPVASNWDTGYGVTCADFSPPYTYTEAAADDGVFLHHYFFALVPAGNGVGGVKIIWRRQVSPPPATPTFGDVPASDSGFPFIEALAASGITAGCTGGNYCPDANLTRRQMAVFLAKALGLHWPY
jgi:hypothetical protein